LETNATFRRVPTFWTKHLTNWKDMNGRQAWLVVVVKCTNGSFRSLRILGVSSSDMELKPVRPNLTSHRSTQFSERSMSKLCSGQMLRYNFWHVPQSLWRPDVLILVSSLVEMHLLLVAQSWEVSLKWHLSLFIILAPVPVYVNRHL